MFFAKLKRQYLTWCLFATGLCIFNLIENILNFDVPRILINVLMVFTFAFVLYAVSYPFIYLFGRLKASRLKCLLFLILIGAAVFSPVVIHDADANQANRGAREIIRNGLAFVGLVGVANQIDDAIFRDAAQVVGHRRSVALPKTDFDSAGFYHSREQGLCAILL